jgi:hypothetical protein
MWRSVIAQISLLVYHVQRNNSFLWNIGTTRREIPEYVLFQP